MRQPREHSANPANDPASLTLPSCEIDNAETGEKICFADLTPGQLPSNGTSETRARFAREQGGIPKVWAAYGGLIALYAAVFGLWQAEPVPWQAHLAGIAIAAISLFPLALWYHRGHQGIPMFELICLAYGISFGTPLYLQYNELIITSQVLILPWGATLMALVLVVLGLGAMVFGFFLVKRSRWLRYLPVIDLPLRPESKPAFLFIALLCGAMGMVLQMLASEEWTAVTKLFSNQFFIAIVLMSQEVYASKSNRSSSSSVLWVSVAAAVLIGMATGMVESAIIPLVLVAIVRWHVTRQIPWRLAFAGLVFFLVISPLKEEYRSRVWYGGGKDGFFDRVSGWLDVRKAAAEAEAPEIPWLLEEESWRRSVKRFDLLHRFAYVCGMTPEAVPFFNGATYEFLLYSLVPRVVWPNKPMATDATDLIDYAYKFRNEFEDKRSANISLGFLPESYANFGVWGVLFVMGLQGAIFALLDMVLNGRWSEGGRAIYLSIMVFFLNGIGTSTVILFGSLIQLTLASAVLMRPFALSFRAERREGER